MNAEMTALMKRLGELQRCQAEFKTTIAAGDAQLNDINRRITKAVARGNDVRPLLGELRDNMRGKAKACADCAGNVLEIEKICLQAAGALDGIINQP